VSGEKHSHGLLEVGVRVLSGKWQAIGAVGRPGWGVAAVVGPISRPCTPDCDLAQTRRRQVCQRGAVSTRGWGRGPARRRTHRLGFPP